MIYHDIVGFDIPVHDPLAMAEVQRLPTTSAGQYKTGSCHTNLQQFKHVIPDIVIHKFWIQASEVRIVDILEDQGGCLALTISHHIQKRDNIGSTGQILEYLDLSLYLLLLHRLEDFDNAFLVVDNIYAFEDLRVLPSP